MVGPFAYLRPDAELGQGSKAGAFVEIKNSEIGEGAKVPHLAYVGDAEIGEGTNLGAGTITANYDGFRKNRTKIGRNVRTGVDTALVAPVEVGDGAYTGAGSVITEDVPRARWGSRGQSRRTSRATPSARRRKPRGEEKDVVSDPSSEGQPISAITQDYTKRLMVFGGRASMELAANIAGHSTSTSARSTSRPSPTARSTAATRSRSAAPTSSSSSPLPPTSVRDDPERRADGAAGDDRRRAGRLRPPDHRGDALVRLRAPGQEVGAARADLRPDRRQVPRGGGRRPRPHHGPPRRPGPGLLRRPARPHDRDADADPVRHRPPGSTRSR